MNHPCAELTPFLCVCACWEKTLAAARRKESRAYFPLERMEPDVNAEHILPVVSIHMVGPFVMLTAQIWWSKIIQACVFAYEIKRPTEGLRDL
jgi:hypothetical protein